MNRDEAINYGREIWAAMTPEERAERKIQKAMDKDPLLAAVVRLTNTVERIETELRILNNNYNIKVNEPVVKVYSRSNNGEVTISDEDLMSYKPCKVSIPDEEEQVNALDDVDIVNSYKECKFEIKADRALDDDFCKPEMKVAAIETEAVETEAVKTEAAKTEAVKTDIDSILADLKVDKPTETVEVKGVGLELTPTQEEEIKNVVQKDLFGEADFEEQAYLQMGVDPNELKRVKSESAITEIKLTDTSSPNIRAEVKGVLEEVNKGTQEWFGDNVGESKANANAKTVKMKTCAPSKEDFKSLLKRLGDTAKAHNNQGINASFLS